MVFHNEESKYQFLSTFSTMQIYHIHFKEAIMSISTLPVCYLTRSNSQSTIDFITLRSYLSIQGALKYSLT